MLTASAAADGGGSLLSGKRSTSTKQTARYAQPIVASTRRRSPVQGRISFSPAMSARPPLTRIALLERRTRQINRQVLATQYCRTSRRWIAGEDQEEHVRVFSEAAEHAGNFPLPHWVRFESVPPRQPDDLPALLGGPET